MKKQFSKMTMGIFGMVFLTSAITFVACKQKEEVGPSHQLTAAAQRSVECDFCEACENGDVQSDAFSGSVGAFNTPPLPPGPFAPVYYNFSTGESFTDSSCAQIKFVNELNSYVTGVNGWNVGYLDENTVSLCNNACTDNTCLEAIDCSDVLSAYRSSLNNIIGEQNVPTGAPGWYTYNRLARTITPFRFVVAWNDCDEIGGLSCGDKVYVLCLNVTGQTQGTPPVFTGVYGDISVKYRCIDLSECCQGK